MILTTHAIIGSAVAQAFPNNPLLALCAGIASHFLMDAVPHWDYSITSSVSPKAGKISLDKFFFTDMFKIGADLLAGLALSYVIFSGSGIFFIYGLVGGVLPDALQFVYKFFPTFFFKLQKFHVAIQKYELTDRPLLGIATQILAISAAILIFFRF